MSGTDAPSYTAQTHGSIAEIGEPAWRALTMATDGGRYPFLDYHFLDCLEQSGSVRPETGWGPSHLTLKAGEDVVAAMPLYLKGHSQGEFVFDHAWADAFERAGGQYYPKMLCAVPFTPAEGPRLLSRDPALLPALVDTAKDITAAMGLSSLHVTFPTKTHADLLEGEGYLLRTGTQYRFRDEGFGDWEGFLSALASRKRKGLKKERAQVREDGLEIDWITGSDITEAHLDTFWRFYMDTGSRKWGTPYLTRTFFSMLTERMADRLLFIMARRGDRYIAGAMNIIGGETLFGRYWGATEYVPFLHFELCYYQAIDFALAHGLTYVDGGAQGEHKIARGYRPVTTYSAHHIVNAGFRGAVARYLRAEREEVEGAIDYLSDFTPFKRG